MLSETDDLKQPIATHNRYWLKFTNNREEAFKVIYERAVGLNQNPLKYFIS